MKVGALKESKQPGILYASTSAFERDFCILLFAELLIRLHLGPKNNHRNLCLCKIRMALSIYICK